MNLLAAIAVAAPAVLAAEKDFFHFPDGYEFRYQKIMRAERQADWPFSVDHGLVACAWGVGQRLTYFIEDPADVEAGETPRVLALTVNPFDLIFINLAHADLFKSGQTLEQRIKLVAPFVAIAQRLCDQPPGANIGPAEL